MSTYAYITVLSCEGLVLKLISLYLEVIKTFEHQGNSIYSKYKFILFQAKNCVPKTFNQPAIESNKQAQEADRPSRGMGILYIFFYEKKNIYIEEIIVSNNGRK